MPKTTIRLAAGRHTFSESEQALAFLAGANAIFTGDTMLTTPCNPFDEDKAMLARWGLRGQKSFEVLKEGPGSEQPKVEEVLTMETKAVGGNEVAAK